MNSVFLDYFCEQQTEYCDQSNSGSEYTKMLLIVASTFSLYMISMAALNFQRISVNAASSEKYTQTIRIESKIPVIDSSEDSSGTETDTDFDSYLYSK